MGNIRCTVLQKCVISQPDKTVKNMKKISLYLIAGTLLVSSCTTYTGAGAYSGITLGSVLGSAIGGIAGGPRGSDVGTIVGMASGAAIGAAIGAQADKQREEAVQPRYERHTPPAPRRGATRPYGNSGNGGTYTSPRTYNTIPDDTLGTVRTDPGNPSGYDPNGGGDDRLYDFGSTDYTTDYTAGRPVTNLPASSSVEELAAGLTYAPDIEIRDARFVDDNRDNAINRGEICKVIFEVYNRGQKPLLDVVPTVVETTGNAHIAISPSIHVERIDPGHGIRYTAMVQADNRLKNGQAKICVSVVQGGKTISQVSEFVLTTRK